jgi:hypothetical protein
MPVLLVLEIIITVTSFACAGVDNIAKNFSSSIGYNVFHYIPVICLVF